MLFEVSTTQHCKNQKVLKQPKCCKNHWQTFKTIYIRSQRDLKKKRPASDVAQQPGSGVLLGGISVISPDRETLSYRW